jgi:adenosine kinase
MKPILVSGSLVYDRIMNYPGYFKDHILRGGGDDRVLNLSFVVDRLVTSRGGTAGNIAHTIKLLGGTPIVVGALGADGTDYLSHFVRARIGTRYIARDMAHPTSSAHIITDREDNQITGFFGGVPPEKTPDVPGVPDVPPSTHIPSTVSILRNIRNKATSAIATISPAHVSVMKRHMRECAALGMTTMFDPGQQINAFTPAKLREMVKLADIVIGNDYEMKILAEKTGWNIAKIVDGGAIVIVTHGAKGSVIFHHEDGDGAKNGSGGKTEIKIPACKPRRVVDPTGAGDAYRAGFLVGLAEGRSLEVAGRMGSVAASFAIEVSGTQEHTFTKAKFLARYKKNYDKL